MTDASDDRFYCAKCDAIKPVSEMSNLTNLMGLMFCRACKGDMERKPETIPSEWRSRRGAA